jgi:hypothetical protein
MVAMSMTEVEYMLATEAAKEALWLTGLVKELCIRQGRVSLHCDSQECNLFGKEPSVSCENQAH